MKFVTFISAPPDQTRPAFQDWCVERYLAELREHAPSLRGGVVRRKMDPPHAVVNSPPPFKQTSDITSYDIVLEVWLPSSEDFRREILPSHNKLREVGSRYISYAVSPRLQKDPRAAESGKLGRRPEMTYLISIKWLSTVTAEQAGREWAEHAAIALRAQPILTKYEQNIVTEVISWTSGTSPIDAFADFSFGTVSDFVTGFHVTREELQDMSNLVGASNATFLDDAEPF